MAEDREVRKVTRGLSRVTINDQGEGDLTMVAPTKQPRLQSMVDDPEVRGVTRGLSRTSLHDRTEDALTRAPPTTGMSAEDSFGLSRKSQSSSEPTSLPLWKKTTLNDGVASDSQNDKDEGLSATAHIDFNFSAQGSGSFNGFHGSSAPNKSPLHFPVSKNSNPLLDADFDLELDESDIVSVDSDFTFNTSGSAIKEKSRELLEDCLNADKPPFDVDASLKQLEKLDSHFNSLRCRKCKSYLPITDNVQRTNLWFDAVEKRAYNGCSLTGIKCVMCGAMTCVGCRDTPSEYFNAAASLNRLFTSCCYRGLLFCIWSLLVRYDDVEVQRRSAEEEGIGFQVLLPDDRALIEKILVTLRCFIPHQIPRSHASAKISDPYPHGIMALFRFSLLLDWVSPLLRRCDLQNLTANMSLYRSILGFIEEIGGHPMLRGLLFEKRARKLNSPGLRHLACKADRAQNRERISPTHREEFPEESMLITSIYDNMKKIATRSYNLLLAVERSDPKVINDHRVTQSLVDLAKELIRAYKTEKRRYTKGHGMKPATKKRKLINLQCTYKQMENLTLEERPTPAKRSKFVDGGSKAFDSLLQDQN